MSSPTGCSRCSSGGRPRRPSPKPRAERAPTVDPTTIDTLVRLVYLVGGGAAALIALDDYIRLAGTNTLVGLDITVPTVLDVIIGCVTFTGSLVASAKLQGLIAGKPILVPGGRLVTAALAAIAAAGAIYLFAGNVSVPVLFVVIAAGLVFGVTMVLPIGGADMPVVISLLNSFTGTAVAMAGFVIGNSVLIIAGALVGASGAILTKLMADAMNRSVVNIIAGGFGGGEGTVAAAGGAGGSVREITADDAAIQLAYAQHVIVVPGYGLAVAQGQPQGPRPAELLGSRRGD